MGRAGFYIIKFLPLLFLMGMTINVQAQNAGQDSPADTEMQRSLTLEEALQIANEQNLNIREAAREVDISRARYRKTNAVFLPSLSVEEKAISTNDPLQAFGIKLMQEKVTQADFNPQNLNDPDQIENYNTSFQVQQPLFNLDKFYQRSAMNKQVKGSQKQWKRTQHAIRFQVKQTYFGLVLQRERLGVIDTALSSARANLRQAKNYHEQGMISKAELLSAEVRVNNLQSKRLKARHGVSDQEDRLRYLLGMEEEVSLQLADTLSMPPVPDMPGTYGDLLMQRSDMQALEYRVEAAKDMLQASRFQFVPSVNLFGQYNLHDEVLLGTEADNYLVGATLKWDLFSGFKNIASIQQSRYELEKARLSYQDKTMQNRTEIRKTTRQMQEAQDQVQLARMTINQAAENLRIRSDRYDQGMERTTDLLQAEVQLEEARMNYLQALYQYNVSLAHLEFLLEQRL